MTSSRSPRRPMVSPRLVYRSMALQRPEQVATWRRKLSWSRSVVGWPPQGSGAGRSSNQGRPSRCPHKQQLFYRSFAKGRSILLFLLPLLICSQMSRRLFVEARGSKSEEVFRRFRSPGAVFGPRDRQTSTQDEKPSLGKAPTGWPTDHGSRSKSSSRTGLLWGWGGASGNARSASAWPAEELGFACRPGLPKRPPMCSHVSLSHSTREYTREQFAWSREAEAARVESR